MRVSVVLVCVCLWRCAGAAEAPFITPCAMADTACMASSAQRAIPVVAGGLPALGIQVLDPLRMERVSTSQAGLDMDFRNTVVKGLRNCRVESLRRKPKKTYLDLLCSVLMTGDYTLGGQLLVFPIQGSGRYKIKIRDILVKIVYDIEEREVDGERYWHMKNWKHTADVKTKVEFNFQNLFNGKNPELANTVQEFANTNWRDIFHEVAPPIVQAIVDSIIRETRKLFDNVPAKYLEIS